MTRSTTHSCSPVVTSVDVTRRLSSAYLTQREAPPQTCSPPPPTVWPLWGTPRLHRTGGEPSKQASARKQASKQASKQLQTTHPNKQTSKQANKRANKQANKQQTSKQTTRTGGEPNKEENKQASKQTAFFFFKCKRSTHLRTPRSRRAGGTPLAT